jgi:C-terminal processing protease CtpA/Prc
VVVSGRDDETSRQAAADGRGADTGILAGDAAPGPAPAGDLVAEPARRLESLAGLLDREVEERLRLEEEVAMLSRRLASIERELGQDPSPTAGPAPEAEPAAGGTRGEITEGSFVAAGFSEGEAAYYRRRLDEAAMARLYLRDRAQREGWLNSERFREEIAALPNVAEELRREMDDETYARYLYATGQPNQVRIRRVLEGSAAAAAGLRAGDVLLRYDGERIYDSRTVQRTTRDGSAGETVAVEILRGGRRIQAYLPRGPIGVTMGAERAPPAGPAR